LSECEDLSLEEKVQHVVIMLLAPEDLFNFRRQRQLINKGKHLSPHMRGFDPLDVNG